MLPSFLPSFMRKKSSRSAFTLSELLISLAILGLIATFTIPKVLVAVSDQKQQAALKESISALNSVLYEGVTSGTILPNEGDSVVLKFWPKLNLVNYHTADCTFVTGLGLGDDYCGTFSNGVQFTGFTPGGPGVDWIWCLLDSNGFANPPNVRGEDQLWVVLITGPSTSNAGPPGTIKAHPWNTPSQTLYRKIYK